MNRWIRLASLLSIFLMIGFSPRAKAEHRVALLINNSQQKEMQQTVAALQKRGFRCKSVENLEEQQLRQAITDFTQTTPTLGTAMIYFSGPVWPGSFKGKTGVCLAGTNSKPERGYLIEETFEQLQSNGGSKQNLIVIDCPKPPVKKVPLPQNSLLVYMTATDFIEQLAGEGDIVASLKSIGQPVQSTLATEIQGAGSVAIAAPDQFLPGKNAGEEWVNSRGMIFCWCPPGRYIKGSPPEELNRYPDEEQKEVTIREGFWIAKYEMTLRENPRKKTNRTMAIQKNDPLTMVNHDDARTMTQKILTQSEQKAGRLPSDWQYNLTTEDQWEYAARAGTTTAWFFGDDVQLLPQYANFADKTFHDTGDIYSQSAHRTLNDGVVKLAPVGSYKPNPWGLHDIHGNVAEWCLNTAIRGGSWVNPPESCRSAYSHGYSSRNQQNYIGYRIVIEKTPPSTKK